jgi:hypothetical protein
MPHLSSGHRNLAKDIAKGTVRAAIDYLCGRITATQWAEWKMAGCFSPCAADLTPSESRSAIFDLLPDLQFSSSTFEENSVSVYYVKRDLSLSRLEPTDREGLSIEQHYHPVRVELHTEGVSTFRAWHTDDFSGGPPTGLTIEWKNEKRIDTSLPFAGELKRLKALVEDGRMTSSELENAISLAAGGDVSMSE